MPAVAAWVAAAVVQTRSPYIAVGVVVIAALVAAACASSQRRAHALVAVSVALGCAVGAVAMTAHLAALHRGPVAQLARQSTMVDLQAVLVHDPVQVRASTGRPLTVVDATATAVRRSNDAWVADHAPITVFAVAGQWLGLLPGQHVRVEVRLRPPRRGDLVSAVAFAASDPQPTGSPPLVQRWAGRVRAALRDACAGLGADERGLVPGLVLGDVAAMPPDLTSAFRQTGLTHLNAVSGANCAICIGAVLATARWAGARRRLRTVIAMAALPAFVVLVRPSPSVLRAALMGGLVLVAELTGRRAASVPILSATVLMLMLIDPFLARSAGFAMSVAATAAIVLVAPGWTRRLARHMPWPIAAAVAVPAAAQVACTPILVAAFGQLTPLAIPANLLAAPAVAPATIVGVTTALVAVVDVGVAAALAHLAGLAAGWLAIVARTLAAMPGAGLRGPDGPTGVALVAVVALVVTVIARIVVRRRRHAMLG